MESSARISSLRVSNPAQSAAPRHELFSTASVQILQAAVREGVTVEDLVKFARLDPAFGIRVLALVNSSAFRRGSQVKDIAQASGLLGIRGLRNIALSLVATDLVPGGEEARVLLANSLRRAVVCRLLGEHLRHPEMDSLFTAGLLLELGLLARASYDLEGAVGVARLPAEYRVVRERASGIEAHPVAGAQVGTTYSLPQEIVQAIAQHHDAVMPAQSISRIAWVGERMAGVFESADIAAARGGAVKAAGELGISEADFDRILGLIPEHVRLAAVALDRDVGAQPDLERLREDANTRLVEMNQQYEGLVVSLEQLISEKTELAQRLRSANEQLELIAATDPLTGLPNRRLLETSLKRDLAHAAREEQAVSAVMVDVDHFKKLNDKYGHQGGDAALRDIGKLLQNCMRQSDLATRYGGEEFVIVLPDTEEPGARIAAERTRKMLERHRVKFGEIEIQMTASFGVATARPPFDDHTSERLLGRADAALYQAKAGGRNRTVVAEPEAAAAPNGEAPAAAH